MKMTTKRTVRNALRACERPQVGVGMSASKKSFDQLAREKGLADSVKKR